MQFIKIFVTYEKGNKAQTKQVFFPLVISMNLRTLVLNNYGPFGIYRNTNPYYKVTNIWQEYLIVSACLFGHKLYT